MTWHTSTTTRDGLVVLIERIRHQGGTVASCQQCSAGILVTWFTL
ncbi:hypothetical protein [Nocardioides sp. SYSU DS0651]